MGEWVNLVIKFCLYPNVPVVNLIIWSYNIIITPKCTCSPPDNMGAGTYGVESLVIIMPLCVPNWLSQVWH